MHSKFVFALLIAGVIGLTPSCTSQKPPAETASPQYAVQTSEVLQESIAEDIRTVGRIQRTDPKTAWVDADVFDSDLARIRLGIRSTATSEASPGLEFTGQVESIGPSSDPQTRTTPVRIAVTNPGWQLRPGMIVHVTFHVPLGIVLTVPREAVLDSGTEKLVYVSSGNGGFEPRRIQAGTPLKDRYPVTEGLKIGEKVATNGVFLLDSQTRLSGSLTGMFGGSKSFSDSENSAFKLTFRIDPDPPQGAKTNTIHVGLTDAAGKPVSDAQVRLTFTMPAMPTMNMPEMRNNAELKWTGTEYAGPIQIMMAGGWNVGIEARRGDAVIATSQTHINAR